MGRGWGLSAKPHLLRDSAWQEWPWRGEVNLSGWPPLLALTMSSVCECVCVCVGGGGGGAPKHGLCS